MFYILAKARYTATTFESAHVEAVLMESDTGDKIIVYVDKKDEFFELIKSGKWLSAKLYARVRTKIKSDGSSFIETRIHPEEVKEIEEKEIEELEIK